MSSRVVMCAAGMGAFVIAGALVAFASAAQVTERSVALSSSSAGASDVTYTASFKAAAEAGAFVIDFCGNSPVVGQECEPAEGFDVSSVSSTTSGFTDVTPIADNTVVVAGAMASEATVTVALKGIANPTADGALYARIVTYDTKQNALNYTSQDLQVGVVDMGGVAIAIAKTIGFSGDVLESLTFCVAKVAITANCANAGDPENAPSLRLGQSVGNMVALVPGQLSEGSIYTQISTNAIGGAVIRLKSNAIGCGGLIREGAPQGACDIGPALSGGINPATDEAKFGVKTEAATDTGDEPEGVLQPAAGSVYNNSTFALNYAPGDVTGVTSAFGDPFLDTAGAPVNNKNMRLTFGATASNTTPAGAYFVDMNMIAVGKF